MIFAEAAASATDNKAKLKSGWAVKSANAQRIKATLTLAVSDVAVAPDQSDRDPWLSNFEKRLPTAFSNAPVHRTTT